MKTILTTLIGSRAHGTANEDSDYDYRSVHVAPTAEILALVPPKNKNNWKIDGKIDDTSYELQKFLFLGMKSNPSILEIFGAPIKDLTIIGGELIDLFPHVWSSKGVHDSFLGYSGNQRKKFFQDKDHKSDKFLAAWLRTVYQGGVLLDTGEIIVDFKDTPIFQDLLDIRSGKYDRAEKLVKCFDLEKKLKSIYQIRPEHKNDPDKLNEFLLKVRDEN